MNILSNLQTAGDCLGSWYAVMCHCEPGTDESRITRKGTLRACEWLVDLVESKINALCTLRARTRVVGTTYPPFGGALRLKG